MAAPSWGSGGGKPPAALNMPAPKAPAPAWGGNKRGGSMATKPARTPKQNVPKPQVPKTKYVQVAAHTRAVPTPKPAKTSTPKGTSGSGSVATGNAALNPNLSLSGNQLVKAGQALANAQDQPTINDLQTQIANQNNQTNGTIGLVGNYYNQLEPYVQQGIGNQANIASGLNTTLSGIASNTQQQLQGIGNGALASLLKYSPQATPGQTPTGASDLTASIARQQGISAQQAGAYQALGANQQANYQGMGASQLGTFALGGQQALQNIAQSGTVKDQTLVSKIAALEATKGALTATDVAKLRQQEVANQVARAGVGIKQQTANTTLANDRAKVAATVRGQNVGLQKTKITASTSAANNAARIAQQNLDNLRTTNTSRSNNLANNSTRQLLAQLKANAAAHKPATDAQRQAVFSHIDYVTGELQLLIDHGFAPKQAYHIVQNGARLQVGTSATTGAAVYKTYYPNRLGTQVLNAAYNVITPHAGGAGQPAGGLTKGDIAWLASLGITGVTRYPVAHAGAAQATTSAGAGKLGL
jgi:hypothetical protein